jgi:hypothetical protein
MPGPKPVQAHEALKTNFPYELVDTNIQGAFTTPAPAEDFDPRSASPAALMKNGLLFRRPQAGDAQGLHAAFDKVFSQRWLAKNRIIPNLQPQTGRTHQLKNKKKTENGYTSTNWAGGIVQGQWATAIGYWVIPAVSKPTEPQGQEGGWNSSSWIGIDGFNSNDVLQAGIEQRVNAAGQASYVAWFEWYAPIQPNSPPYVYQTNISNFAVSPGQTVYCSVQYVNNKTAGQIYFANQTTGQHFSITLAPPPGATFSGNCSEWIMEAPDGGETFSSLPKFTPVHFTTAMTCGANGQTVGNPQNGDYINVVGFNKTLTSVALANDSVTINFAG